MRVWRNCCAARCSRCPRTSCPRSAGSYRFAQNLLAQVAYETLSRRDRKARHLAVAAHLRATFAGDGDEVIDAVAQHYQDALAAVPTTPTPSRSGRRRSPRWSAAAQRALRSGAPRGASANYTAAARLIDEPRRTAPAPRSDQAPAASGAPSAEAAALWEAAAEADLLAGDYAAALDHAEPGCRRTRGGRTVPGRRPRRSACREGAEPRGPDDRSRDRLAAAVQVLRPEPDRDTVRALSFLARNAASTGHGDADSLTSEALQLGQALDVDGGLLARLFASRGVFLGVENRLAEAIARFEYAARIAERSGDSEEAAIALIESVRRAARRRPPRRGRRGPRGV